MRAGLVRPTTLDTFIVGTLDDCGGVTVHAAPVITHGFEGDARLLRLLEAAFAGLQRHSDAPWKTGRTAFYLSLPDPDRPHTGLELIADKDLRRNETARWKDAEAARENPDHPRRAKSLLERAARLADWPQVVQLRALSMNGTSGVAEMLEAASRDLNGGAVEVAIIGGVDSWIDPTSLRWLEQRGRLKSPVQPAERAT